MVRCDADENSSGLGTCRRRGGGRHRRLRSEQRSQPPLRDAHLLRRGLRQLLVRRPLVPAGPWLHCRYGDKRIFV